MTVCKHVKTLSKTELEKFIDSFDVVLSDCDGVLWREMDVIKGSPETVKKLKELGKRFFFITNNCMSREQLVTKCTNQNYAATVDDILCSSYLTAIYLKQINFNKTVYVVGCEGISQELSAQGIKHFGVGPDLMLGTNELDILLNFKRDPEVGAVIVGFDKYFSYPKLVKAATYLSDPRVHFIGTNPDVERPSPNENRYPDAGCFLKCIQAITRRKANVLGKPESFISEVISKKYGVNPSRTLIIGDNLSTDILLGKRCGFKTLLVMSGVTRLEDLKKLKKNPQSSVMPDFYADKFSDLLHNLF